MAFMRLLKRSPWLRSAVVIVLLLLVFLCGVHLVASSEAAHGLEVELAVLFQLTALMALFIVEYLGARSRPRITARPVFVVARGAPISQARSDRLSGVPLRR